MSVLPNATPGQFVMCNGSQVRFSFWPVLKNPGGCRAGTFLFATDPWPIMFGAVKARCGPESQLSAIAFLEQAQEYYRAATVASLAAAKPVLFYYCFMNLAKAFVLSKGVRTSIDNAQHGLCESVKDGGDEFVDAELTAFPSASKVQVFDEFLKGTRGTGLIDKQTYPLSSLLAQILPGHRLWLTGEDTERFVALDMLILQQPPYVWLAMTVSREDLGHTGLDSQGLLQKAKLPGGWVEVQANASQSYARYELPNYPTGNSPLATVDTLVTSIRNHLWQNVTAIPPYRKYYLYAPPEEEQKWVLPQLLSAYAVMYYLSSITRYRPLEFQKILDGNHGPFVQSFLNDQPSQFLFLMASHFAERNITKAALV